jgi:hypothetical protein
MPDGVSGVDAVVEISEAFFQLPGTPEPVAAARWSATTRATVRCTVCQKTRSSRRMLVLSVRCANQAITSSRSRVSRTPGRAQRTCSVRTRGGQTGSVAGGVPADPSSFAE